MTQSELVDMESGISWIYETVGMRDWLRHRMDLLPRYLSERQIPSSFHVVRLPSIENARRSSTSEEYRKRWCEAIEWVIENLEGTWAAPFIDDFRFEDENEAVQFKLRFG